jgi:hypothetical protein
VQLPGAALLAARLALGDWLQYPLPAAPSTRHPKALILLRTAGSRRSTSSSVWDGPQATPWIIAVVPGSRRGHGPRAWPGVMTA